MRREQVSETIDVAAIKVGEKIYSVPRPGRHHTIFRLIYAERTSDSDVVIGGTPNVKVIPDNQGFLTSTGRFVDRTEAAAIAMDARQIISHPNTCSHGPTELNWPPYLYSEDLW